MKPDLLITQTKHCDYPIFRLFLKRQRQRFNKVIVYFSEHNRFPYFDHFIQTALQDLEIIFLDPVKTDWSTQDWRNVSTNEMLKYSNNEWVCSIEQDWFAREMNRLLFNVEACMECMEIHDLIGWWEEKNKYIHPSFWFIKRELLDKTNKDFAAHNGYDHFGWITKDVERLGGKIMTTQEMGFKDFEDCFHLGGVNQNYLEGLKDGYIFHRPEIFSVYNHFSQFVDVKQSPEFMELMKKIEQKLPVNEELLNKWKPFFDI